MAMSKDRVRFHLAPRYFTSSPHSTNGMEQETCVRLLKDAFNVPEDLSRRTMCAHSQGFNIICRPSQFARFIVFRHEYGECINGVRDLDPKIVQLYPDHLADLADRSVGFSREDVARLFQHASKLGFQIPEKLLETENPLHNVALDVSENDSYSTAQRAC